MIAGGQSDPLARPSEYRPQHPDLGMNFHLNRWLTWMTPEAVDDVARSRLTVGLDVHLRAAELEPLVERVERVGQRSVAALITGALNKGMGEVMAFDRRRWQSWCVPLVSAALGGYLTWTTQNRAPP